MSRSLWFFRAPRFLVAVRAFVLVAVLSGIAAVHPASDARASEMQPPYAGLATVGATHAAASTGPHESAASLRPRTRPRAVEGIIVAKGAVAAEGIVDRYFTQAVADHESLWGVKQVAAQQPPLAAATIPRPMTPGSMILEPVSPESILSEQVISDHCIADQIISDPRTVAALRTPAREAIGWTVLPDGLLYKSYLAGPHEPRHAMVIFSDTHGGMFWDATLGGRVGFLRHGTFGTRDPQGWQWDFEGAVMVRLDMLNSEDVESMDFRFGTLITRADGPWSSKVGYFHISSHVGDEYMERHPWFERINYVTESMIAGLSYQAAEPLRLYGEFVYSVKAGGGGEASANSNRSGVHARAVGPTPRRSLCGGQSRCSSSRQLHPDREPANRLAVAGSDLTTSLAVRAAVPQWLHDAVPVLRSTRDTNRYRAVVRLLTAYPKRGLTLWRRIEFPVDTASPERGRPLFG
ncbi:MAG: DUF1207 domain-containing protein [Novipirellula sp. JB048]